MAKPPIKIATRFYLPICFEAGYLASVVHMHDILGDGFSAVLARFDGKKMDVFRVAEDVERVKPKMIAFSLTPEFAAHVPEFTHQVEGFRRLAEDQEADPRHLVEQFSELYPWSVMGSFLTNFWSEEIPAEHRDQVMEVGGEYRLQADYLMRALTEHFEKRFERLGLSPLTSLEILLGGDSSADAWKEAGFIFWNGEFTNESWQDFLERKGYAYEEESVPIEVAQELRGMTAFAGVVEGAVRVAYSPRDLVSVQEGDVLVAAMTTPSFSSVFPKVGAIVTDEGGMTCHAAIIARELQKPCVIGTKFATALFKDGDLVRVDAGSGVVTRL